MDSKVNFLVVGDWGGQGYSNQTAVAAAMNSLAGAGGQQFIVSTGDNVYKYGLSSEDDPLWDRTWTDVFWNNGTWNGLDNLDWYSVLGNHDYGSALGECANRTTLEACAASGGRAQYQIGQKRNDAANATYYLEENYVKRFGDGLVAICFVDTNPIVLSYREKITEFNLAEGLPVPDWQANVDQLEACLANSTATVKFVVAHESPYSNGAEQCGYPELRPIFGPIFEKYGVDIFFAGHSHDQEHLVAPEGYHVVISGSGGGSKQYGFNSTEYSYFQQPSPGFAGVSVAADGNTRVKFYDTESSEPLYEFTTNGPLVNDTASFQPNMDWYDPPSGHSESAVLGWALLLTAIAL